MLCMLKPFFKIADPRLPGDGSWASAVYRTENSGEWDARSTSMRINVAGILRQRLAADEEIARKRQEESEARAARAGASDELNDGDDIINPSCDDEATGSNVTPPSKNARYVSAYVNAAKHRCIDACFSNNDNARLPPSTQLLSGRTPQQVAHDATRVNAGDSANVAKLSIQRQDATL